MDMDGMRSKKLKFQQKALYIVCSENVSPVCRLYIAYCWFRSDSV